MNKTEEYFENLNQNKETSSKTNQKQNIGSKVRFYIYCCLCFLLMILNLILYLTNKTKAHVHLAFIILSLLLPAIGFCCLIYVNFSKHNQTKVVNDILGDVFPFITIIFSFFVLVGAQLFGVYKVDGESMMPNLKNKQIVYAFKYNIKPKNGDIVVWLKSPNLKRNNAVIKRVWAKPKDEVEFIRIDETRYKMYVLPCDSNQKKVYSIDGNEEYFLTYQQIKNMFYPLQVKIEESETDPEKKQKIRQEFDSNNQPSIGDSTNFFRIPNNKYLLIGDNFYNSTDSRKLGLMDKSLLCARILGNHGK